MPFLTTPTSNRLLPMMVRSMDGCQRTLDAYSCTRTYTHTHYHAENCIFPSDGFSLKIHHDLICGWDELPIGKGNRRLGPEDREVQSIIENN